MNVNEVKVLIKDVNEALMAAAASMPNTTRENADMASKTLVGSLQDIAAAPNPVDAVRAALTRYFSVFGDGADALMMRVNERLAMHSAAQQWNMFQEKAKQLAQQQAAAVSDDESDIMGDIRDAANLSMGSSVGGPSAASFDVDTRDESDVADLKPINMRKQVVVSELLNRSTEMLQQSTAVGFLLHLSILLKSGVVSEQEVSNFLLRLIIEIDSK